MPGQSSWRSPGPLSQRGHTGGGDLSDCVLLRDEAAPVSAVLGEVVQHYPVLVGLGHEGRGEVDVAEDVYGVDLAHWEGGDLSLAFHVRLTIRPPSTPTWQPCLVT